ncbi:SDR family oxidoreductase [Rubellimicrobium roseum]|nr:SDR family oxidoreductase [Rubellimicrobium roseum]
MTGNTILITGGGSGIGRELARRFHDRGNTVIVTGRRREALDETADGRPNIHATTLDVTDPQDIAAFAARITAEHPALNVLINNAGIMRYEAIDRARDLSDAEETVTANLLGPIRMTDALVEHLSRQPDAAVVNVSSGLAFVPLVAAPTYSATKAAVHSYTVSLREALKGRVEVIELAPPAVQTELTPGQSTRAAYLPLDAFMEEVMALFAQAPTPREILVQLVAFQRNAEAEHRFDEAVTTLNDLARRAREGQ